MQFQLLGYDTQARIISHPLSNLLLICIFILYFLGFIGTPIKGKDLGDLNVEPTLNADSNEDMFDASVGIAV